MGDSVLCGGQQSAGSQVATGADSPPEHLATDNSVHREADWSAVISTARPGGPTRTSIRTEQDTGSEDEELSAALSEDFDEGGFDLSFGGLVGDPWPTTQASPDEAVGYMPGRPKAAAKMLVRSGLRCPLCFLRAWVCLCNRAPIELDRRGTAPCPSERYWLFCMPGLYPVVPFGPSVGCRWRTAHLGSARGRHRQGQAAVSERPAIMSSMFAHPSTTSLIALFSSTVIEQIFMRHSYRISPLDHRQITLRPNRGPKSAPEPRFDCPAQLTINGLRGVRVSPLSAGGEGLCKARSRLLKRPGKLAEGIQQQLGFLSCHRHAGSWHRHLHTLSRSAPWGNRLRLWRFKYKFIRFMKRRHRRKPADIASLSSTQCAGTNRGHRSAADVLTPACYPSCGARPASLGGLRRLPLLVLLLNCTPMRGTGTAHAPQNMGRSLPQAPQRVKRAWLRAQCQACLQGHAWYRGRVVWSTDVPHHAAVTQPSRRPKRNCPGATPRGATARLKIMTLNVGHMSAFLWSELKAYLGSSSCDHDVICLQELHWSQTCQFCVGGWSAVVSAGPDRSDGVMVLVSPKFDNLR